VIVVCKYLRTDADVEVLRNGLLNHHYYGVRNKGTIPMIMKVMITCARGDQHTYYCLAPPPCPARHMCKGCHAIAFPSAKAVDEAAHIGWAVTPRGLIRERKLTRLCTVHTVHTLRRSHATND